MATIPIIITMLPKNRPLADIHTHILPAIDDGAKTVEESLDLLFALKKQGVSEVVCTPHFDLAETSVNCFLEKRNTSFRLLSEKINNEADLSDIKLRLGAEVKYDPNLVRTDLSPLCIEGTSYLLLEPLGSYPFNFEYTVDSIVADGITLILAHIERFSWLAENFDLLDRLSESGAVFQCTASALFNPHHAKRFKKLLKRGYVDLIASDIHSLDRRPPMLEQALSKMKKHSDRLIHNSFCVLSDESL